MNDILSCANSPRTYFYPIFLCILLAAPIAAQELIIRFKAPVSISFQSAKSSPQSSDASLQKIVDQFPPQDATILFPTAGKHHKTFPINTVQVWRFKNAGIARSAAALLRTHPNISYAYPNTRFATSLPPADSLVNEQWYLSAIGAREAWQVTSGQSSIVIGIIDTGVDYLHEDLIGQIWTNTPEDLNQNGQLDSLDLNGIDDDNNGYIDDVIGWDFTDAPAFPDRGDYLVPDNDPMDEFLSGHGTQASGIIAAAHNGIGIQGIAPGTRIMALRAGTASGFLEEDDVAEAVVYAADNGAKIVNMSFGDAAVSYLLQDAIRYGVSKGVLFIAASGNNGTATANYPAGFDETISVGATRFEGDLASFSNYGSKLDLVAPGQDIWATGINNRYGPASGTSFSAPIAAAVAGLVWSQLPGASAETIKGILQAGCRDLGLPGWDLFYGHGLINAATAVTLPPAGIARIDYPSTDSGIFEDQVAIIGVATGPNVAGYSLSYGLGETPLNMLPIGVTQPGRVVNDTLAVWDVSSLADTSYSLELRLHQTGLADAVFRTVVTVDRTPPQLVALDTIPMFIGSRNGFLVQFKTDDKTRATVNFRESPGGPVSFRKNANFLRKNHNFLLDQRNFTGTRFIDFYLENSAGLAQNINNNGQGYRLTLSAVFPEQQWLSELTPLPLKGFLLDGPVTDIDLNSRPELIISRLSEDNLFGSLEIIQYVAGAWQTSLSTDFPAIPRDAQIPYPQDGFAILAGFGSNSIVLGGNNAGEFPNQIVWDDTSDFWASRLADLDGDSRMELLGRKNGRWSILDTGNDWEITLRQSFPDTTSGSNQFGVPLSVVADLDGNGWQEIFYTDGDGDLYRMENTPQGQFYLKESVNLGGDAGNSLLQAADIDGDGNLELLTVVAVSPQVLLESNINTQFWQLCIWSATGPDNALQKIAEQNFQGITRQNGIYNGLSVADIDGDGSKEIILSLFPDAYVFRWFQQEPVFTYFLNDINSNAAVYGDFDGNGQSELLLNSDNGVRRLQFTGTGNRPSQPINMAAVPLDTATIRLTWETSSTANFYKIYRRVSQEEWALIDSIANDSFLDQNLSSDTVYSYAVTQIDSTFPEPESAFSTIAQAQPNAAPALVSVEAISSEQIRINYSEPMGEPAFEAEKYHLMDDDAQLLSIARAAGRSAAIATFDRALLPGNHQLIIGEVADAAGTPLPAEQREAVFAIPEEPESFYLVEGEIVNKREIRILLSASVDKTSAGEIGNYQLEPDGLIIAAVVDSPQTNQVILQLNSSNRLGSLGVPYFLTVNNLRSLDGRLIAGQGSERILLTTRLTSLDAVSVYPNPYNVIEHQQPLVFGNLPSGTEIRIFSAAGQLIRSLLTTNEYGGIAWDLRTDAGKAAASGVYIYVAKYQTQEAKGKFILINR